MAQVPVVGDSAKHLFDLAADGADLSTGTCTGEVTSLASEGPASLTEAAAAFATRDADVARTLLRRGGVTRRGHAATSCGGVTRWGHAVGSCGGVTRRGHAVGTRGIEPLTSAV